jgi:cytoskeleton-associated protein 5
VKNATDDSSQGGDFDVVVSSPRTQRNQLEPSISTKRSSGFQSDFDILDSSNHRDRNLVLDQTAPSKSSKAGVVHNIPAHSGCKEIEIALPPKTNIPTNPVEDITVTETNVGDYIYSKNWKLRKASYDVLEEILVRKMKGRNPMNDVDSREIDQCVTDSLLVEMGKDSNASALDSGLRFLFGFIDFCKKGSDPDTITPLIASIVTGPAMTSARPSTVKSVEAVLMKAMQVSKSKPSSIHIVVGMLLDHGITSRNPKVVSKSVAIMLDAARAFGVAHLPLSKVIASSDKILSHPNGEVREYGINILAELCRSFGSKEPISDLLSRMKPAQVSELDALLSAQRGTQQPSIGLRFDNSCPQSNVLEILQAGAVADAAEKFALREPVNIFDALRETDYYQKMKEAKWSEKVNALDTLLRCGGEKPYKLTQPSSSVNYKTLISDLKKLLSHTHYAVKSKSALALAMLAEGVGSKLFSHLRPLLLTLVDLTKDKKIATSIEICLDSLFDNVIGFSHLLEEEGGLISVLDEKKQKNALIRKTALSYLNRCVKRSADAKGRGTIDSENVNHVFTLCVEKASDSDAGVRREASSLLTELLSHPDESVQRLTSSLSQDLEQTNSRVFKLLSKDIAPSSERSVTRSDLTKSPAAAKKNPYVKKHPYVPSKSTHHSDPVKNKPSPPRNNKAAHSSNAAPNSSKQDLKSNVSTFHVNDINIPSVQEANNYVLALNIPNWNVDDLDGDVVSGLQSSNWKCRCAAISSLITFSDTSEAKSEGLAYAKNVFVIVKSGTKEFRDGNFNILKAACHLVLKICDLYQSLDQTMDEWICKDAVAICVQKVADKKFVDIIPDLFFRLCEVQSAGIIFLFALSEIAVKKSPVMIEGLLMLSERFCVEFGIDAIGRGLNEFVTWVSEVGWRFMTAVFRCTSIS